MDGDGKKPLRIAILEFYKLNLNKGKYYPVKNSKTGNCNQKPGYGTRKATDTDLNDSTKRKKF